MNGSDPKGKCTYPQSNDRFCGGLNVGGTSDLVDRQVPSLRTFQDNWAAGLFTVNRSAQSSFHIGFAFNRTVNFTKVELDLFNCPEWGIAAPSITVYTYNDILNFDRGVATALHPVLTIDAATSCNSTVTVCIPLQLPQNPQPIYIIDFTFNNTHDNIQWVHIAEVRFFKGNQLCRSTAGITLMNVLHITNYYTIAK